MSAAHDRHRQAKARFEQLPVPPEVGKRSRPLQSARASKAEMTKRMEAQAIGLLGAGHDMWQPTPKGKQLRNILLRMLPAAYRELGWPVGRVNQVRAAGRREQETAAPAHPAPRG